MWTSGTSSRSLATQLGGHADGWRIPGSRPTNRNGEASGLLRMPMRWLGSLVLLLPSGGQLLQPLQYLRLVQRCTGSTGWNRARCAAALPNASSCCRPTRRGQILLLQTLPRPLCTFTFSAWSGSRPRYQSVGLTHPGLWILANPGPCSMGSSIYYILAQTKRLGIWCNGNRVVSSTHMGTYQTLIAEHPFLCRASSTKRS